MLTTYLEYSATAFTTSTVAPVLNALYTSLTNYSLASSYTALFDQYRFLEIEMWVNPSCSMATPGAPEGGTWVSAVDYDDSSAPASYTALSGKQGAMQTSVLTAHYHKFKPKIALAAYSGAFTSYASAADQWIDCSSNGVAQYGLKFAVSATSTAITFNVIYRARVQFRGIA